MRGPGRLRPRGLRARLLATIILSVGLSLAVLTTVFNVAVARQLSNDADEVARARARAELSVIEVRGGRIEAPVDGAEDSIETRAWVFEGGRVLQAPNVDHHIGEAAAAMHAQATRWHDVPDHQVRLHAMAVTDHHGARVGTVVAGVSLAPYDRTRLSALVASLALAVALLVAVSVVGALILRAALAPVARMTREAAAWSEHDTTDMRFGLGRPHDEVTDLAATLDALLDRLAAGMRRERRLTAEVSHELRTPLAQIRGEVDLALSRHRDEEAYREALTAIGAAADRLTSNVETLLATARPGDILPRGTADAVAAARMAIERQLPVAEGRGIHIELEATPDRAVAGADAELITSILHPLLDNACRLAAERVTVSVGGDGRTVRVRVRDDGPGVAEHQAQNIFVPGRQGDDPTSGRAGLGLPLARRLAHAAGGEVRVTPGPGGDFTLYLPAG